MTDEQLHHLRGTGGKPTPYSTIASNTGLSEDSIRGRVSRYRRQLQAENDDLRRENEELRARLEAAEAGQFEWSAKDDTDWQQWIDTIQQLKQLSRMVKIAVLNDLHFPDHDEQALEIAFSIVAALRPDVIVTLSDGFDFDVLSLKYSRAYNRRRVDPFDEVQTFWNTFVTRLKIAAPSCTIIGIQGNHDGQRLQNYLNEVERLFPDRITRDFNALVRADGQVLWLGYKQEIRIGSLVIEHGKKSGENAAKASLKTRGWTTPKIQGHAHKTSKFVNMVEKTGDDDTSTWRYPVVSVVTGALCNIPPNYIEDTKSVDWNHGMAVAHVNMHGDDVHIQDILFHKRVDGTLVATFGELVFEVMGAVEARKSA